jgi:hypothetical protein
MFDSEARFNYSANQKILMATILVDLCRINIEVKLLEEIISDLEEIKKKRPELLNYVPSGSTDKTVVQDSVPEKKLPAKEEKTSAVSLLRKYVDIEEEFIAGNT